MEVDYMAVATVVTSLLTIAGVVYGMLYKNRYSAQVSALASSAQFMAQVSDVIVEVTTDLADKQLTPVEVQRISFKLVALKAALDSVEAEITA